MGNVWSQIKLGQIGKGVDINPTVRFGNYPENIFLGQNISIGYGTHIYAGPNSKVTIGDNTMIGPYVFITTEAFQSQKTILREYIQVIVEMLKLVQMSGLARIRIYCPELKLVLIHLQALEVLLQKMFQVIR